MLKMKIAIIFVFMFSSNAYIIESLVKDKIKIHEPEPNHVMVREGGNITLTCAATHPWFLCLWVHPGDDGEKLCSIQEDGEHTTVCAGVPRAELIVAGDNKCHVHLTNVTLEEAGDWMCLLSQAGVYHTDRIMTKLSVATPTTLTIEVTRDNENIDSNDPIMEDIYEFISEVEREEIVNEGLLELLEDESVNFHCHSKGGFPQPQFYWSLIEEIDTELGYNSVEQEIVYGQHNNSNLHTSSVKYAANLADNGKTLICATQQLDINTNEILYNVTSSVKLFITPKSSPLHAYLTEQQDVVAGVVISCFLIIFCVIIVIIFTVRSSKTLAATKKYSREPKAHESYIIFLEEPVSSTNTSGNQGSDADIKERSSDKESGIDVSHGDFVSFSSSDLYGSKLASDKTPALMSGNDHHNASCSDENPHDESSEGCAASDGGLSNISVFDCPHGCFHEDEEHSHYQNYTSLPRKSQHFYTDAVLNTDL